MKILYLFACLFILCACNNQNVKEKSDPGTTFQTEKAEVPEKPDTPSAEELKPYFRQIEVKNTILIEPGDIPQDGNGFYCYFALKKDKAVFLKLRIQFWGDEYGNSDTFILDADGEKREYRANESKTNPSNEIIAEDISYYWYDKNINQTDLKFLKKIVASERTTLTFIESHTGNSMKVISLSDNQKQSISRTIDYYTALDGAKIPKEGMVNISQYQ